MRPFTRNCNCVIGTKFQLLPAPEMLGDVTYTSIHLIEPLLNPVAFKENGTPTVVATCVVNSVWENERKGYTSILEFMSSRLESKCSEFTSVVWRKRALQLANAVGRLCEAAEVVV